MAGATSKHGKLEFSGKEVDFSWFMDRFEARMYLLDLHKCMNDEITTPAATPDEEQADAETRIAAEAARDVLRMKLWCELIQCLDRKSTSFLRPHKGNGTAAWKALKQHYKSSERPRIQQTLDKLTNLKMNHGGAHGRLPRKSRRSADGSERSRRGAEGVNAACDHPEGTSATLRQHCDGD